MYKEKPGVQRIVIKYFVCVKVICYISSQNPVCIWCIIGKCNIQNQPVVVIQVKLTISLAKWLPDVTVNILIVFSH